MALRIIPAIRARLAQFGRAEGGSSGIMEMLVAIAMLNMVLMAFFGWWEAYRAQATLERTAYTVSDLIARQRTAALPRTYLDGIERTAEYLVDEDLDVSLRVTQVTRNSGNPTLANGAVNTTGLVINWSYSPCNKVPPPPPGDVAFLSALPILSVGPPLLVVEVSAPFQSDIVNWALGNVTFSRKVIFMPRFAPTFGTPTGTGTATCIT